MTESNAAATRVPLRIVEHRRSLSRGASACRFAFAAAAVVTVVSVAPPALAAGLAARVDGQAIRIDVDGHEFATYLFAPDQKYPYIWPVCGPTSARPITMRRAEPYPHHSSVFFGCDQVDGFNFWQEGNDRGQIVSTGARLATSTPDRVEIVDRCEWRVPGKAPILTDERQIVVTAPSDRLRFIDFAITLRAPTDVQFARTNHSLFSMRVATELSPRGGGTLENAAGHRGEADTFARKCAWCDFSGTIDGQVEGIAILDHPENASFPSSWFTRDYGFASPTPMYWLTDEGWTLRKGESLSLRYRVVVHTGTAANADLAGIWRRWAGAEGVEVIPVALGFAGTPVNRGESLLSNGERQFITFYDADRKLTVGSRTLGSRDWHFVKLDEQVGWDSHNRIAMAFDRRGCLHLTANHHCSDLNYFRTSRPGDIDSFEQIDRFGATREKLVTYPHFMHWPPDDSLMVMYRHGSSGDGERLLLKYDESDKTWTPVTDGPIISGRPRYNAYPMGMAFDPKGRLHIAWCWRETPAVETNERVCYAVSPDGGRTWQTSDGRPLATPITPETAEVIDPVHQGDGLLNAGHLALDAAGRPWISYIKYGPNGGTQGFVTMRDADGWHVIQMTDWAYRWDLKGGGSLPASGITIPSVSFPSATTAEVVLGHARYYWSEQAARLPIDALRHCKPGELPLRPHVRALRRSGLDFNYAVANDGPLPKGEQHWMVQRTAGSNRDREPADKMPPTMVYVVVARP